MEEKLSPSLATPIHHRNVKGQTHFKKNSAVYKQIDEGLDLLLKDHPNIAHEIRPIAEKALRMFFREVDQVKYNPEGKVLLAHTFLNGSVEGSGLTPNAVKRSLQRLQVTGLITGFELTKVDTEHAFVVQLNLQHPLFTQPHLNKLLTKTT